MNTSSEPPVTEGMPDRFYETVGIIMNLMGLQLAHPDEAERVQHVVRILLEKVLLMSPQLQIVTIEMATTALLGLMEKELGTIKASEALANFDTSKMRPN